MKRKWRAETKVWRDPNVVGRGKRGGEAPAEEPKAAEEGGGRPRRPVPVHHNGTRIVTPGEQAVVDPREAEREKLLEKLLHADGHIAISKAARAYVAASFDFPRAQEVWLQLLEHSDEDTVLRAIGVLGDILTGEPPTRRAVLDSRLRRIEDLAEEAATRAAAAGLRRMLSQRWAPDSGPSSVG